MPQIDELMFVRLPKLLGESEQTLEWHYNSRCATCDWQTGCHQRTERDDTVSMIPDLSLENSRFIRSLIKYRAAENRMTDIEELGTLINQEQLSPFEERSPHTAKQIRKLLGMPINEYGASAVLNALTTHTPKVQQFMLSAKCRH